MTLGVENAGFTVSTRGWTPHTPAHALRRWQVTEPREPLLISLAPVWHGSKGKLGFAKRGKLVLPPGALTVWVTLSFSFCCHLIFTLSSLWQLKRESQHWNQLFPSRHMWNSQGTLSLILEKGNIFNSFSMHQPWSVVESQYFHLQFQVFWYSSLLDLLAKELLIWLSNINFRIHLTSEQGHHSKKWYTSVTSLFHLLWIIRSGQICYEDFSFSDSDRKE